MGDNTLNGYNESALLRLKRIVAYYQLKYDEIVANYGVTTTQFEVLRFIKESRPCTVTDVADFMIVSLPTASRMLLGLANRGFILVVPDPEDGRRKSVKVTTQGYELLAACGPDWNDLTATIFKLYGVAIEQLEAL